MDNWASIFAEILSALPRRGCYSLLSSIECRPSWLESDQLFIVYGVMRAGHRGTLGMEQCPVRQMNWASRWMRATQTDHAVYQVHVDGLRTTATSLSNSAFWSRSWRVAGRSIPLRAATCSSMKRPSGRLWKSPCRYVPKSARRCPRRLPANFSMTGAPLHQEGAGQPLHRCKSHMDFVSGQLCALACSQEALALRYPTCCSMRGLLLQEDSPRPRVSGVGDSTPSGSKRTAPSIW